MNRETKEVDEEELCGLFEEQNQVTPKISKIKLFLKLSEFDEKNPDKFTPLEI